MAVAIVLAAGSGSRMNSDIAKQYLKIKEKEVLYYSLKAFQDNMDIEEIILVCKEADLQYCKEQIVEKYDISKVKKICQGGKERFNSVYNGLLQAESISLEQRKIILIHDGARPFVTQKMINDSIATIKKGAKACTIGVPVKDTIKIVEKKQEKTIGVNTPDRSLVYQIQTPQTFEYDLLRSAYEVMLKDENHNITDDTMLVEQYKGELSEIVMGTYENIKITTPEDMEIAEKFVEKIF